MNDKEILKTISENIRLERLRKHYSQEQLAELTGISTKYINMIEKQKSNPSITIVVKIVKALEIDLNTLLS